MSSTVASFVVVLPGTQSEVPLMVFNGAVCPQSPSLVLVVGEDKLSIVELTFWQELDAVACQCVSPAAQKPQGHFHRLQHLSPLGTVAEQIADKLLELSWD